MRVSLVKVIKYYNRAARLRGFEADLNLKGQEFNTLLSILYVGYIIMQIPSCVSPTLSMSSTILTLIHQEHATQPHRTSFTLYSRLHGHMGHDIYTDRFVTRNTSTLLALTFITGICTK